MSFRGGRGGGRGGPRGGGGFGRGRGGFNRFDAGPPERVVEMGTVTHDCEGEIVCESTNTMVPYFNAPVYLKNKNQIGKIEEVLGPINKVYFTVKCSEGVKATSFKKDDIMYISPDKLLPMARFLNDDKPKPKAARGGGAARGRGALRGSRGSFRGAGRGAPRGGGFRGARGAGFRGGSRGGFRGRGRGH